MTPESYFAIADKMLSAALNDSNDLTARAATARVLRLGCIALEELISDLQQNGDLLWAWDHLNSLGALGTEEEDIFPERFMPIRRIVDVFLLAEKHAFKKYGVPNNVQSFILQQARGLLRDIENINYLQLPDIDTIRGRISNLAEHVCIASMDLEYIEQDRRLLKRGALVLSGAGVVGTNASVDAITNLGLAPWMTALSGVLGGKLIDKGIG